MSTWEKNLKPYSYKPGQCGNPNGRPKKDAWVRELEGLLRVDGHRDSLAEAILKVALNPKHRDWFKAIQEIQNRVGGPVALKVEGLSDLEIVERLVELLTYLRERLPVEHHGILSEALYEVLGQGTEEAAGGEAPEDPPA